ncbi:Release factor glutamine methyltransferase [Buchnera aphidicola (Pterocallis alni)]|uniref:peptide chain release factor N(5)-glutamine methyltransferase n=1 Tax=Buchnera aphidicola TaxID=9 RepID=UPI0034645A01
MNIKNWLKYAKLLLSYDNSVLDAEILLSYVLKKSRVWIKIFDCFVLNKVQINILNNYLYRRKNFEPIAYIIQKKEFWSLSFIVSKNSLIPRPETEILVEQSLNRLGKTGYILDLGSGCGNIALSLAFEKPYCSVLGIDYILELILLAKMNAVCLNISNATFVQGNWFQSINMQFNIIVSNPPYLSVNHMVGINKEVSFEPYYTLFSGSNGMSDISKIIYNAKKYLFLKGWLLIEYGIGQTKIIHNLFKENDFYNISVYKDYHGYNRVIAGQKIYE